MIASISGHERGPRACIDLIACLPFCLIATEQDCAGARCRRG
jgi:hypothetical protein